MKTLYNVYSVFFVLRITLKTLYNEYTRFFISAIAETRKEMNATSLNITSLLVIGPVGGS